MSHVAYPPDAKPAALAMLGRHPFRAAWWLRGRHRQTLYGPLLRRRRRAPLRHEQWETPDDDLLDVYLAEHDPKRPTLLVLHGLEGSVDSHYVVGLTADFYRRGWNVAAFEFRSCSGRMNRARRLYHSGETSDLAFVVGEIAARWPESRLYLAGVSLGGNVIAKWLGELGDDAPTAVAAAAAISPPFDLTVSGPQMDQVLGGFYTRQFLRTLIPKAVEKERQFPGCVDIEAICRSTTFAEFDTHGTAALHGFRDAMDYWESVSCGQFLAGIRRPILLVASADDPFNPAVTLPHEVAAASPFVHALFTANGGHVGFVRGWAPFFAKYWAEEQVARFFAFCEESV